MRRGICGAWLVVLLTLGCDPGANEPKEPVWGKQPCEYCAMLMSDQGQGAQVVTTEGERLYFDDIGCMAAWTLAHPGSARREWVRTADTRQWSPAESAGYQQSGHTPMGFGFIAVSAPGAIGWSQVTEAVQQKLRNR